VDRPTFLDPRTSNQRDDTEGSWGEKAISSKSHLQCLMVELGQREKSEMRTWSLRCIRHDREMKIRLGPVLTKTS